MEIEIARKQWRELHDKAHAAGQEAAQARALSIRSFVECAAGRGKGPSSDNLIKLQRLERMAEEARNAERAFLNKYFG